MEWRRKNGERQKHGKTERRHEEMERLMGNNTLLCPANRKGRKVRFSGWAQLAGPVCCRMDMHTRALGWLHAMLLGLYGELCKPLFAENRPEHTSGEGRHSGDRFSFRERKEVFQKTERRSARTLTQAPWTHTLTHTKLMHI